MERPWPVLPLPLERARKFGWMRYADHEDVRAGRVREVVPRVLRRARRWRVAFVVLAVLGAASGFVGAFWAGLALGAGLSGFWYVIRDLEALHAHAGIARADEP